METDCIGRDPLCPCQDGLACHYRDASDGTKAMPVPTGIRAALAELVAAHSTGEELDGERCHRAWAAARAELLQEKQQLPAALLTDEQIRDLVKECGLDWRRGFVPLFDGDDTNRYAVLVREVERAVRSKP